MDSIHLIQLQTISTLLFGKDNYTSHYGGEFLLDTLADVVPSHEIPVSILEPM